MKYTNIYEQPTGPGPDAPGEGNVGRIMMNYYTNSGIVIDFNNMVYTTPTGSVKIPTVNQNGKPVVITQEPVFPGGGFTIYSRPAIKNGAVVFGLNYITIVSPTGEKEVVPVVHTLHPIWEDVKPNDITFLLEIGIAIGGGGGGAKGGGVTPSVLPDVIPGGGGGPGGVIGGGLIGQGPGHGQPDIG